MNIPVKWLDCLPLNTKLLLAVGVGFVITLLVGLASLAAIRTLSATAQQTYEQDLLGVSNILEAQVDLTLMGRGLRWMAMSSTAGERAVARKNVVNAEAAVRHHIDEGRKRFFRDEGEKALNAFDGAFPAYSMSVKHAIELLDKNDPFADGQASQFLAGAEYNKTIIAADQALATMAQSKQEGARRAAQQSAALAANVQMFAGGLLLLGLAVNVGLGLLVGASIRRPLNDLRHCVEDLAAGRLDIAVPHTEQGNEIGAMAQSIRVLQQGAQVLEGQRWVKQGLAEIDQAVLAAASYQEFGDRLMTCLAQILGLIYGALYVSDATHAGVQRMGGYGCDDSVCTAHFAWGQGLVGQVAEDRRQIVLALNADAGVGVTLGLGVLHARQVLIFPVVARDELLAVLELGAREAFDSRQIGLLDALLPVMATKMQILAGHVATRELLAQTQALAAAET